MSDITVCGFKLNSECFDGIMSMNAFALSIEIAVKIKEMKNSGDIHSAFDSYSNNYDLSKIEIVIDGIDSYVSIDGTWVSGDMHSGDDSMTIHCRKKYIREFIDSLTFVKEVKVRM